MLMAVGNAGGAVGIYNYFKNISVCRCLTVNGGGQSGTSLNVDGGPTSVNAAIKAGQFISFRTKNRWQMVKLTEDFDTDASGVGTLRFEPAIRDVPVDGEAVIVRNPFAKFKYRGQEAISQISAPMFAGMAFDVEESLEEISGEIQSDLIWAWDAENLTLAPQIGTGTPTFAQATAVATYVNSAGGLSLSAANTPRFEYDALTLALKGLFVEDARTNGLIQSEDESFGTTQIGATLSLNYSGAPNGTATLDKIVETTANSEHTSSRNASLPATTANAPQAVSVNLAAAERSWAIISTVNRDGAVWRSWINLGTGAAGTVNANHAITITRVGGTWRVGCVFNSGAAAGAMQFAVSASTGDGVLTYVGTLGAGIYIWGRQWEADKPTVGSYISTAGAAVSRNADLASLLLSAIAGWDVNQYTVLAEFQVDQFTAAGGPRRYIYSIDNGTLNEAAQSWLEVTTKYVWLDVLFGGALQAQITNASAVAANTPTRILSGQQVNNFSISKGGAVDATDLSGSMPSVTTLRLGAIGNDLLQLNGWLRRLRVYNKKLPAQMDKALSA